MKSGVYKIVNLVNNKIYIGSSIDVFNRKKVHFRNLERGTHINNHLQLAFNKYGKEFFIFRVIRYCSVNRLLECEQFYIDKYNAYEIGYNFCPVAGSKLGSKHNEETKQKMSKSAKGNKHWLGKHHTEKTKKILSEKNKNPNDDVRKKIGLAHKGKKLSKSTKEKISKSKIGCTPWNKGLTEIYSEETKKKMREAQIGKKLSEETKKKIGIASKGQISWNRGGTISEETKRKISTTLKNTLSLNKESKNVKFSNA